MISLGFSHCAKIFRENCERNGEKEFLTIPKMIRENDADTMMTYIHKCTTCRNIHTHTTRARKDDEKATLTSFHFLQVFPRGNDIFLSLQIITWIDYIIFTSDSKNKNPHFLSFSRHLITRKFWRAFWIVMSCHKVFQFFIFFFLFFCFAVSLIFKVSFHRDSMLIEFYYWEQCKKKLADDVVWISK